MKRLFLAAGVSLGIVCSISPLLSFASTPLGVSQGISAYGSYPMPENCKSHFDPSYITGAFGDYDRQNQPPCRVSSPFQTSAMPDGFVARLLVLSVHPVNTPSTGQTAVFEAQSTGNNGVQYPLDSNGACTYTQIVKGRTLCSNRGGGFNGVPCIPIVKQLPISSCQNTVTNPRTFTAGTPVVVPAGQPIVIEWAAQQKQDYSSYVHKNTWYGRGYGDVEYGTVIYSFGVKGTNFSPSGFTGSQTVTPASGSPTTYTLSNGAGQTLSITVNATPLPALTISATPTTVASGGKSTITWSAVNVTSCTVTGPAFTTANTTSGSQMTGNLNNTSTTAPLTNTYLLTCNSSSGSVNASVNVTVNPASVPPPPDICSDISGNQSSVPSGCQAPSSNPGSCIPPGYTWNGSQCVLLSIPPPPPPPVVLPTINSFSSTRVQKSAPSTLSWSVSNLSAGTSCSMSPTSKLSGGSSPSWNGSGTTWNSSVQTVPLTAVTSFTLSCTNSAGTISASTNASLIPTVKEV